MPFGDKISELGKSFSTLNSPSIPLFQRGTLRPHNKEGREGKKFVESRTLNTIRHFRAKGFTLIEISIFIVLIGIFMAGVMSPFLTSLTKSEQPEIVASAVFLAAERLEQLQTSSYSSITSDASPISLTGNYSTFSRQVTVTLVDANLATSGTNVGYKKVVVTVFNSKLPGSGISLTSLFTDYSG
jgi:type II secretory pathway pseudopilin PulG